MAKVRKISEQEILMQKDAIKEVAKINQGKNLKAHVFISGCQMNENDSEKLMGMLKEMGYTINDRFEGSDVIIFNTCCVRDSAEQKIYGYIGALKAMKRKNPKLIIGVTGCMTQQPTVEQKLREKYKHVDLIFGNINLHKFPEMLLDVIQKNERHIEIDHADGYIAEDVPIERKENVKAWVTVMYGCNNFCSYCIVPHVRGRERSRTPDKIIEEVKELIKMGAKEVTLLGQNVNSYGKDLEEPMTFAQLLKEVNKIEGIDRIRFMTSHPKDLSDELLFAIRDCDKVCNDLHIPFQAGSTKVLKEMNRKYTKEQYIALAQKAKEIVPGIALSTDIIVGFPGETEEDFQDTLDMLRKVRFEGAFTFMYSKRTGTPAATMENQIPEEVKKDRFDRLVELQNTISREQNELLVGTVQEILVEGPSKNDSDIWQGRTISNKIVNFKRCDVNVGDIVNVKITAAKTWSLEGEL